MIIGHYFTVRNYETFYGQKLIWSSKTIYDKHMFHSYNHHLNTREIDRSCLVFKFFAPHSRIFGARRTLKWFNIMTWVIYWLCGMALNFTAWSACEDQQQSHHYIVYLVNLCIWREEDINIFLLLLKVVIK